MNKQIRVLVPTALLLGSAGAMAQVAAFTDAVTNATTNIGVFGAALVGLAAVGVVFMIAIKYVKKIRGAA